MKERELIMENKKKHWFQNMLPWQKKRLYWSLFLFLLISISFLVYTVSSLYQDKVSEDQYWNKYLQVDPAVKKRADQYSKNATEVKVGTYVENLKEINLKANNFSLWHTTSEFIKEILQNLRL